MIWGEFEERVEIKPANWDETLQSVASGVIVCMLILAVFAMI